MSEETRSPPLPRFRRRRWDTNHGDDHILSFCALAHARARLVAQPCFSFGRPAGLRVDGARWNDRNRRARRMAKNSSECAAGRYLAFHYVQPPQQLPLTRRAMGETGARAVVAALLPPLAARALGLERGVPPHRLRPRVVVRTLATGGVAAAALAWCARRILRRAVARESRYVS